MYFVFIYHWKEGKPRQIYSGKFVWNQKVYILCDERGEKKNLRLSLARAHKHLSRVALVIFHVQPASSTRHLFVHLIPLCTHPLLFILLDVCMCVFKVLYRCRVYSRANRGLPTCPLLISCVCYYCHCMQAHGGSFFFFFNFVLKRKIRSWMKWRRSLCSRYTFFFFFITVTCERIFFPLFFWSFKISVYIFF